MDIIKTKKTPFYKKKAAVFSMAAALFAGAVYGVAQVDFASATVKRSNLLTAEVKAGEFTIKVSGHGVLAPRDVRWVASNVEGKVEKSSRQISEDYFATRARGSQIGAWASPQSHEIQGRKELEDKVQVLEKRFEGQDVPCPEFWGGYILSPTRMEFWQSGDDRLHTRWRYIKSQDNSWESSLVAP